MTYQIKLVDTNGRVYATQVGQANTRKSHSDEHADAAKIERMLQHPEKLSNDFALIQLARRGNATVRQTLFSRMDEDAFLDIVISLAGDGDAGAIEALIREVNNPKCWEMLLFFAQRHDERAIEFVLGNTHREGGLRCAITLAEQACPAAKEYIRDFCALIRLADRGNPHVIEALYAHKDYNLDCRNRIMRLFAAKQQEVKHAMEGCRGGGIVD